MNLNPFHSVKRDVPAGVAAADAILAGVDRIDRAVNELRELIEDMRTEGGDS